MKNILVLILWASTLVLSTGNTFHYNGVECNMCAPGLHVKRPCSATSQTECEACPADSYNDQYTQDTVCRRCMRYCMRKFEQVVQRCNRTHDIVCRCEPGYWLQNPGLTYCEEHRGCKPGFGVIKQGTPFSDTKCRRCRPGTYSDVYSASESCLPMTDCVARGMIIKIPGNPRKDNLCIVSTVSYEKDPVDSKPANPPAEVPPQPTEDKRPYYHAAPMETVLPFDHVVVNATKTTSAMATTTISSTQLSGNNSDGSSYQSSGSVGAQIINDVDQPWKSYVLFAGLAVGLLIIIFVVIFSACFLLRMKQKWPFKKKERHTTYDEAKDPLNIGQQMHKVFGFVAANCHVVTWQEFIRSLRGNEVSQGEIDQITSKSRGSVVQHIYQCLSLWYAKNNSATVEDVISALIECGEHSLAEQVSKDNPQTRIIFR